MQCLWTGESDVTVFGRGGYRGPMERPTTVMEFKNNIRDSVVNISDTYRYSSFGFRSEEKFSVLPSDVKTHIETVLLNWLVKEPKTRMCLGNALGLALTILAHSTHQMYMDWDVFLKANMDDNVVLRVLRCFKTTVPEPGTYMGEIVAQFFQHCRQQSNLNVKRKMHSNGGDNKAEDKSCENSSVPLQPRLKSQSASKRSEIDNKFETIMSLKRTPLVSVVFRIVQNVPFSCENELLSYLKKRVFSALCYEDGSTFLSRLKHEFIVYQHNGSENNEAFFSLDIVRKSKYDDILDRVFESVNLYNSSLIKVTHRMGECNVVYCSDTVYFMDISKRLFMDNSVTFIFCYLTNKFKPIIESKEDTDAFGLAKILSSVEYSTKCSLKRNHNSRMGHGPLSSVISEGGLNESAKFVNNMMRGFILRSQDIGNGTSKSEVNVSNAHMAPMDDCAPQSPTYSPTCPPRMDSPASTYVPMSPDYDPTEVLPRQDQSSDHQILCDDDASTIQEAQPPLILQPVEEQGVSTMRSYAINEPYVNAFLNRPVECGNMY